MEKKASGSKKHIVEIVVLALAVLLAAVALLLAVPDPAIVVNGQDDVEVDVFATYTDAGARARFLLFDISDRMETENPVNTARTGRYTVRYFVKFLFSSAEAFRSVTVADRVNPVVTLQGDEEVRVEDLSFFNDPGVIAVDNYDGDLTGRVITSHTETAFTEGERKGETEYIFTYSVLDAAGNGGFAIRKVIAKDVTPPVITLVGEQNVTVIRGQPYTEQGATAKDNVSGAVAVAIAGGVDTAAEGVYVVRYMAEDAAGNRSEITRNVTVRAPMPAQSGGVTIVPGGSYVALTFDDGPSSNTTAVLDVLAQYNVKATFFILNYSESHIPVLRRMLNEGHTLAIHSYSHDYSAIYTSAEAYMQGVYKMQEKIRNDTGFTPTILRFPGGSSNTVSKNYCPGVMTQLARRVEAEGFTYFDWNVDSGDADGNCMGKDYIVSNVKKGLRSGRVNVVLMHDSGPKTTTPQALPEIITDAQARGFTFVPLSSSVPAVHHGINN
ncbi:MAG: polysaccharide deacetylase family protein [Clostridia bacterium]|nr:polysaccharide deacetylase family protein [Clostridia bacterium]